MSTDLRMQRRRVPAAVVLTVWGLAMGAGAASAATADQSAEAETFALAQGDLSETLEWEGTLSHADPVTVLHRAGTSRALADGASGGLVAASAWGATTGATTVASVATLSFETSSSQSIEPSPSATGFSASPAPTAPSIAPSASASASAFPTPSASPTGDVRPTPTPTASQSGAAPSDDATSGAGGDGVAGLPLDPGASGAGSLDAPAGPLHAGSLPVAGPAIAVSPTATQAQDALALDEGAGLVTWMADAEATVVSGDVLYRVDDVPVVLLVGEAVLYRDLAKGDEGEDVRAVEAALAELGYGDDMTVDAAFTAATADAVTEFQSDHELEATGELDRLTVVMRSTPGVVTSHSVEVGDDVVTGQAVLGLAESELQAEFQVDASQRADVQVGSAVQVALADGEVAEASVATVTPSSDGSGACSVTARLALPGVTTEAGTADIVLERVIAQDALLVDPAALLLLEGDRTAVRLLEASGEWSLVEVEVLGTSGRLTALASSRLSAGDTVAG